jgi:3-methyladenine DNA glycosylase AlkD
MKIEELKKRLEKLGNKKNLEGMKKFGINPGKAYGVNVPKLRSLAKEIGKNHELAQKYWKTELHEIRHIAAMIDEPEKVTKSQMNTWAQDFYSWDLVDGTCNNLFVYNVNSYDKAFQWSKRKEEFVKRAGFVLMATMAVHRKELPDKDFEKFFPVIKRESVDERNFVKKAVNWALRQIGKKNKYLNKRAIETAEEIKLLDSKSAKWIANDTLRELKSEAVQRRINNK